MNPLELQVLTLISRSGTPADFVSNQDSIPRLPLPTASVLFGPSEIISHPAVHDALVHGKPLTRSDHV